jgi:CheY-like chemotaxis protein
MQDGQDMKVETGEMTTVEDIGAATRVVVAEDDVLLREGLASLLDRSGFDVVGLAADGTQLLALVREKVPGLVVTDIRMPPTHTTEGLDAALAIREELPDTGILVLSAHVDVEHAMELLASGRGIGYLLKSRVTDVADFIDTLGRIARSRAGVGVGIGTPARRPFGSAQCARAGGAGADGGGSFQCRHRTAAVGHRRHRRKARAQYSDEAEPAGDWRRSPPSASGHYIP